MADIEITVDGGTQKRLLTAGKYCDRDILITSTVGEDRGKMLDDLLSADTIAQIVTYSTSIRNYAIYQNQSIDTVDAPLAEKIGSYAFYLCNNLSVLNAPMVKNVGTYACYSARLVRKLDFNQLEVCETGCFSVMVNLESLIIRSSQVCVATGDPLGTSGISLKTGFIYVPKSLLEDYKVATNWATYADQIRAIEDFPEITGG